MKFVVIYRERKADPATAQRRAGPPFIERALPPGLKVHHLLSSVAEVGGFAVVETSDARDLQHLTSLLSAYECRIEPVIEQPFGSSPRAGIPPVPEAVHHVRLPEMPPAEPHEGAFSDDDIYDTED